MRVEARHNASLTLLFKFDFNILTPLSEVIHLGNRGLTLSAY